MKKNGENLFEDRCSGCILGPGGRLWHQESSEWQLFFEQYPLVVDYKKCFNNYVYLWNKNKRES